jgi:hypothetical protein
MHNKFQKTKITILASAIAVGSMSMIGHADVNLHLDGGLVASNTTVAATFPKRTYTISGTAQSGETFTGTTGMSESMTTRRIAGNSFGGSIGYAWNFGSHWAVGINAGYGQNRMRTESESVVTTTDNLKAQGVLTDVELAGLQSNILLYSSSVSQTVGWSCPDKFYKRAPSSGTIPTCVNTENRNDTQPALPTGSGQSAIAVVTEVPTLANEQVEEKGTDKEAHTTTNRATIKVDQTYIPFFVTLGYNGYGFAANFGLGAANVRQSTKITQVSGSASHDVKLTKTVPYAMLRLEHVFANKFSVGGMVEHLFGKSKHTVTTSEGHNVLSTTAFKLSLGYHFG